MKAVALVVLLIAASRILFKIVIGVVAARLLGRPRHARRHRRRLVAEQAPVVADGSGPELRC